MTISALRDDPSEILDQWFSDAVQHLQRGEASDFMHLLTEHSSPAVVVGSNTTVRTHFLAFDANGWPAVDIFASAIASSIVDFCIPRSRVRSAMDSYLANGSTNELVKLQNQARELFVASDKSGEGGELLLFMLMERVLGIPQLISKMTFKTSASMHVHGSDGIHADVEPDGTLNLYWGESKLHESTSSAISECFTSLAPFLVDDGEAARNRDLLLLSDHLDADSGELTAKLLRYFDTSRPEAIKVRFRGVGLIGFDHKDYPDINDLDEEQTRRTSQAVERWQTSIGRHVDLNKLASVQVEIFCIPFPSVMALRSAINKCIGVTK